MQKQIDAFIDQLAQTPTAPDTYNEYAPPDPYNAIRRANFRHYLLTMAERQPAVMLVMEAPGYRGCRLTGVPVTSRKILLEGVPALGLFGDGFADVPEPGFERIKGEQSATIVWGTLAELGVAPVIWNTYPFHPHRPGEALTNRKPRRGEIEQGQVFLRAMLDLFTPQKVIAVGNVAHETLAALGLDCAKVRHPAQGGKNDFVAGLRALLAG